jgi:hypothetical protein
MNVSASQPVAFVHEDVDMAELRFSHVEQARWDGSVRQIGLARDRTSAGCGNRRQYVLRIGSAITSIDLRNRRIARIGNP